MSFPKPLYLHVLARRQTFQDPAYPHHSHYGYWLAEHGFLWVGSKETNPKFKDTVQCCRCGLKLHNWNPLQEHPATEHRKHVRNCSTVYKARLEQQFFEGYSAPDTPPYVHACHKIQEEINRQEKSIKDSLKAGGLTEDSETIRIKKAIIESLRDQKEAVHREGRKSEEGSHMMFMRDYIEGMINPNVDSYTVKNLGDGSAVSESSMTIQDIDKWLELMNAKALFSFEDIYGRLKSGIRREKIIVELFGWFKNKPDKLLFEAVKLLSHFDQYALAEAFFQNMKVPLVELWKKTEIQDRDKSKESHVLPPEMSEGLKKCGLEGITDKQAVMVANGMSLRIMCGLLSEENKTKKRLIQMVCKGNVGDYIELVKRLESIGAIKLVKVLGQKSYCESIQKEQRGVSPSGSFGGFKLDTPMDSIMHQVGMLKRKHEECAKICNEIYQALQKINK